MRELRDLVISAKVELENWSIDDVAKRFAGIIDEFLAIVEAFSDPVMEYKLMLDRMIGILSARFGISQQTVHVRHSKYGTDVWGPIYWKFFHYSSILITYMYSEKEINDMIDFPILLFNINHILPCSVCKTHYMSVKHSNGMRRTLKELSFGNVMTGTQTFHNIVTSNINALKATPVLRPMFNMLDFAKTYGCLDQPEVEEAKSLTYIRNRVDGQPPTHRLLSTFYALVKGTNYMRSSNELKAWYDKPPETWNVFISELENAVMLNIDKSILETNVAEIEKAICELYVMYPEYAKNVLNKFTKNNTVAVNSKGQTNKDMFKLILDDNFGRSSRLPSSSSN